MLKPPGHRIAKTTAKSKEKKTRHSAGLGLNLSSLRTRLDTDSRNPIRPDRVGRHRLHSMVCYRRSCRWNRNCIRPNTSLRLSIGKNFAKSACALRRRNRGRRSAARRRHAAAFQKSSCIRRIHTHRLAWSYLTILSRFKSFSTRCLD